MYTLACIKCHTQYQDSDPDPYYCPSCNDARKEIAKKVDAQQATRPRKNTVSALKAYDSLPRVHGFPRA